MNEELGPRRKTANQPMKEAMGLGTSSEINVPVTYTSTHKAEQAKANLLLR